jgi:hypothetical protein
MFLRLSIFCLAASWLQVAMAADYGLDCSFPIHNLESSCGDLLGDRKTFYEDYVQGCREFYGKKGSRCDVTEAERLKMSKRQPKSMVNYTDTGFKKIRAPEAVMKLLTAHWEANKHLQKQENWPLGNTYVNHWASPTYMVSVEDQNLRGTGGMRLKNQIWDAAKTTIEEWTGMELKPSSMYGIRVYTEGAVLNPHVDRLPLVSSCIVNVAQDVDEDWPLEIYDRHDRAINVTMKPGDMVLYESGSLMHGRPFPLKGRYYANIFIHFEPTGRSLGREIPEGGADQVDDFFPPYLLADSEELDNWAHQNPYGWKKPSPSAAQVDTPEGHYYAQLGDMAGLRSLTKTNPTALTKKDRNGWTPLHEAVRGGHSEAVKFLIDFGAHKNARTSHGFGASPLALAITELTENHPVSRYLMGIGAENVGPDEL